MAKARKRRAARRTKKTAKRGKRKIKAAKKTAKRGTRETARRKKSARKRKRTTSEGMRRALKMKQAAEEREREEHPLPARPLSPAQMAESVEPDPVSHNLREQGDVANIIQNTSNRRAG